MTEQTSSLAMAEALLRGRRLDAPSVAPLVSVVRSGEQFLIIGASAAPTVGLGAIVLEWGYEVTASRRALFKTFLSNFESTLETGCPPGVAYQGTYAVFQQSERSLGSFRTIWVFGALADMQAMTDVVAAAVLPPAITAAAMATATWTWGEAVKVLMDFRDTDYAAGRSQVILQPAAVTEF